MLAYCRSRLRSREEAEDAAQTTFLLAQRALARGVRPLAEATWLVTIAQNVCLNRYRSARRQREHELPREPQELERLLEAAAPEQVDVAELKDAVESLPELQRRAILLREWQGYSYAEIERELGLGKAAVETLIFRARRTLSERLGDGRARRRALDLGSLASALKSLLGGAGAAKLAGATAVVVAGTGIALGGAVEGGSDPVREQPAVRVVPAAPAPSPAALRPEPAWAAVRSARTPPASAAAPSAGGDGAGQAAPPAALPRSAPVPAPAPAAAPAAAPAPAAQAAAAAQEPAPARRPPAAAPPLALSPAVAEPVRAPVEAAAQSVEETVETVGTTAAPVVEVVQGTVDAVAGTLTGAVAPVVPVAPPVLLPAAPKLP